SWYHADQGRLMAMTPLLQQWLGPCSALNMAGGGPVPGAEAAFFPLTQDDLAQLAARRMASTAVSIDAWRLSALATANVHRLGPLTSAVGAGHNGPITLLGNLFGDAAIYQTAGYRPQRMAEVAVSTLAQMVAPNPTFGVVVPASLAGQGPPVPPNDALYGQIFTSAAQSWGPVAMRDEVSTFLEQLGRLKGQPEQARAFLRKVQQGEPVTIEHAVPGKPDEKRTEERRLYGLKGRIRSSASGLKDRYELAKDEALRPLREAMQNARR